MPSLEVLYNQLAAPPNFLITHTSTSTGSFTSPSSTPSLDQISSAGSRSSTPFLFPPFALTPHPMLPSGENPMTLLQYFQQSLLNNINMISHTGAISSPNDLQQRPFIKCRICLAAFPSLWLLEQHTILQHSGQPSRRLQQNVGAASPAADNSSTSSREEKPFQCDQCGQSYRYRSAYIKHREQNHRARLPADKLFTCDICGMQFRYLKSFRKHRLNHTFEVVPTIGGVMGSMRKDLKGGHHSYAGQHQLRRHLATVAAAAAAQGMAEGGGGATDTATSAATGDQSATTVSEMQVSSSNEVELQVTNAPSTNIAVKEENAADSAAVAAAGATAGNATQNPFGVLHYPTERPRDRQLFACSFCSKTVRSKENLKLHVRKHTGERPFACLFCGRAFGGKSDLTRHVRIHTGERPYHCEMCGKCFARADYLSKHLTTHLHNSHSARSSAASTE